MSGRHLRSSIPVGFPPDESTIHCKPAFAVAQEPLYLTVARLSGEETRVHMQSMHKVIDLRRFLAAKHGLPLAELQLLKGEYVLQNEDDLPSQAATVIQLLNGGSLQNSDAITMLKTAQGPLENQARRKHHHHHRHHHGQRVLFPGISK